MEDYQNWILNNKTLKMPNHITLCLKELQPEKNKKVDKKDMNINSL